MFPSCRCTTKSGAWTGIAAQLQAEIAIACAAVCATELMTCSKFVLKVLITWASSRLSQAVRLSQIIFYTSKIADRHSELPTFKHVFMSEHCFPQLAGVAKTAATQGRDRGVIFERRETIPRTET